MLWVRRTQCKRGCCQEQRAPHFPSGHKTGVHLGSSLMANSRLWNWTAGLLLSSLTASKGRGGTWTSNGEILFTPGTQSPIFRVSVNGGTPVAVTGLDRARHTSHRWPFALPDGKHFLYLALNHDPSQSANDEVHFASLDGREDHTVIRSLSNAIFASGFLAANLQYARLSPLGDRIALQIDVGANDIWILDLARGIRTRLTFGPVANMFPVWSPDGKWIAYGSQRNGRCCLFCDRITWQRTKAGFTLNSHRRGVQSRLGA